MTAEDRAALIDEFVALPDVNTARGDVTRSLPELFVDYRAGYEH